jgi:hypothetical protein
VLGRPKAMRIIEKSWKNRISIAEVCVCVCVCVAKRKETPECVCISPGGVELDEPVPSG